MVKKYVKKIKVDADSKFTPAVRRSIIKSISERMHYDIAAEANGVSYNTLIQWLELGKQHLDEGVESIYSEFFTLLRDAEMNVMNQHVTNIANRVRKWKADAWILERRWPKYYGNNSLLQTLTERLDMLEMKRSRKIKDEEAE